MIDTPFLSILLFQPLKTSCTLYHQTRCAPQRFEQEVKYIRLASELLAAGSEIGPIDMT